LEFRRVLFQSLTFLTRPHDTINVGFLSGEACHVPRRLVVPRAELVTDFNSYSLTNQVDGVGVGVQEVVVVLLRGLDSGDTGVVGDVRTHSDVPATVLTIQIGRA